MLFPLIGIHRCFAADGGVEFLNIRGRCFNEASVGLANANVRNLNGFKTCRKRIDQKTKFSNGRFRLDAGSHHQVAVTLTISFERDLVLNQLKYVRLRGVALAAGGFGRTGVLLDRRLLTFREGARQRKKEVGQNWPLKAHLGLLQLWIRGQ